MDDMISLLTEAMPHLPGEMQRRVRAVLNAEPESHGQMRCSRLGLVHARYPEEGGKFWMVTFKSGQEWVQTLRTASPGMHATIHYEGGREPMPLGAEVARLNRFIGASQPKLFPFIVDRLNEAP